MATTKTSTDLVTNLRMEVDNYVLGRVLSKTANPKEADREVFNKALYSKEGENICRAVATAEQVEPLFHRLMIRTERVTPLWCSGRFHLNTARDQ